MVNLSDFSKAELNTALQVCQNSHSSNITRDYLGLFIRIAKSDPNSVVPIVDILISNISVHRSNLVSSLYGLIKLADVNGEMRRIISSKLSAEQINSYIQDGDAKVANNAIILKEVLSGAPLAKFEDEKDKKQQEGNTINYNLTNSNVSINSPYSTQSLYIENVKAYDGNTLKLLEGLRDSINKKDKGTVLKILGFIADKSFDLLVAILAGKVLRG